MKKTLKKITLKSETLRNLDPASLQDAAAMTETLKPTGCTTFQGTGCTTTNVCSHCRPCL